MVINSDLVVLLQFENLSMELGIHVSSVFIPLLIYFYSSHKFLI